MLTFHNRSAVGGRITFQLQIYICKHSKLKRSKLKFEPNQITTNGEKKQNK